MDGLLFARLQFRATTRRPPTHCPAIYSPPRWSGATVLSTHRLAALDIVDEIVVLDNGVAVECGTQSELLRVNGHYFRLWQYEHQADRTDGSHDG
jgi:ABC-type protease/lipase transport system fused ATPase/permease subunit